MADDPQELILDILRSIRADMSDMKGDLRELKEGQISIRDDIHALRGDLRRHERAIAAVENDIERIKTRLDLVEE